MYEGREIFANAPLEYVAAEVRFPYAPLLRQPEVLDRVALALGDRFPRLVPSVAMSLPGTFPAAPPQMETITRAFNKPYTWGVTVSTTALNIETTAYRDFEELLSVVQECLVAVSRHVKIAAVERIGLRYVDEFRVPVPIENLRSWRGWVADRLIDHLDLAPDLAPHNTQTAVQYGTADAQALTVRFGSALTGTGIIGNEPLKRRHGLIEGPYFALDLDSYWHPAVEDAPDFDVDSIVARIVELHRPIGVTFQNSITEQLKAQVLRREPSV